MRRIASCTQIIPNESTEDSVKKYTGLVKKIAYHLLGRLPDTVHLEDLVQSGLIGLLEAKQRFDSNKSPNFEAFASLRIRGAMLDDLRKTSWMPRSTHQNMRKIAEAIKVIENSTKTQAKAQDIAAKLGVSMQAYAKMASAAYANELVSFETLNADSFNANKNKDDPFERTQKEDLKARIAKILKTFPEREQLLMSLYYIEGLNFKEIAAVLKVTEARICQLHGQALARLQAKLKD